MGGNFRLTNALWTNEVVKNMKGFLEKMWKKRAASNAEKNATRTEGAQELVEP